ncbi:hypothetical protein NKDENANG_01938 [Candidatus Entotheonellaceae bacterium PAL068K]
MATAYAPLLDNEPELTRTMAAALKHRIAFGEHAGEKGRRIGSGFGDEGERPERTGPRGASVNGFSVPANHRYSGASTRSVGAFASIDQKRRRIA